ncbi:winged helix-turn-helix domain-containing protein [Paenibacillus hexagrammi]|uniref:Winged helix-turn-helix domain-containing protein n=1 Tax=Paenibacillus hexagrammi TaxID=2908839 RepID=A0ABY3SP76_9BACL|nr:winged helix-turn-helix domain-containing protein [Paenibacillus sp. YPD9-1]UJF35642.1 winged helix-turn-helix domain-containing protein [Paenibacillus sp. YPD9-1]
MASRVLVIEVEEHIARQLQLEFAHVGNRVELACEGSEETDGELIRHNSMIYRLHETIVNLRSREVFQNGININFTSKEFELLVYLIEHRNEVLSRERILNDVWGYDFRGSSNLVDVYIRFIRKKLIAPYPHIRTIRGVGYILEDQQE